MGAGAPHIDLLPSSVRMRKSACAKGCAVVLPIRALKTILTLRFDFLSFALVRFRSGAFLLGNQICLVLVPARRPYLACGKMPSVFLFADQFNARAGRLALP